MSRAARRGLRRALRLGAAACALVALASAAPVCALRFVSPPTTAFMWRSQRADPASGRPCAQVEYTWVDRERIADDLALAVVVAEDQRFLEHHGFDGQEMRRAWREWRRGGPARGASTLTQQLAKNLFLSPERTLLRKGTEAWFATWIELLWPKSRILEVYLNVVQFGPCRFGAQAASRGFFGVNAAALSTEQAALLAAVLPNPHALRAHDPGPYARERTREILGLMREHEALAGRLRARAVR